MENQEVRHKEVKKGLTFVRIGVTLLAEMLALC